jgi:hypothetical protein
MSDLVPDLERLRVATRSKTPLQPGRRPPRHKKGELFIMGPLPVNWFQLASRLPGKALHIGLEVWFWAGLQRNRTVSISLSNLRTAPGVSRQPASRGLAALEKAELVAVVRWPGRKPLVTLLDVPGAPANRVETSHVSR